MVGITGFKARVEYEVTNGTQTTYTFPFSYLRKKFVMVSILHSDGTETSLEYGVDYIINDLSMTLTTPAQVGEHLIIYRQTSTDKIITWNDGSILLAKDMNTEDAQLLHLQEEQQDYITANAISTKVTSDKEIVWDALNHRVVNVSDPKDPQDVVTKHYMENVQDGFVSANTILVQEATKQANAAKTSQESAKASATQADESERSSLASANLAEAWATSTTSPDNIADAESTTGKTQSSRTWALFSKAKSQEANTSATHAKASETNAKTSETNATVSATNAKASETNAKISERTSSDSASASASSASAAATSATNAKASETKALASENNAKASETNASVSAEAASSSETNALASEIHARNSAQTASTSETNAKTSEMNAKTSETNAKTSETNASDSKMSARASEINAKTSETNAANSAKQAAESAGVFQDFTGATATTDGTGGKVPKPLAGEQNKVLKADGTWGDSITPQTLWGVVHSYPENYDPPSVTNQGWNQLGLCAIYYTQNRLNKQPTQYGQLINIPANTDDESTQLWIEQNKGTIFSRGGNATNILNETSFKQFATLEDISRAEQVNNYGDNWVRYESGLQLCWVENINSNNYWSFPVAFAGVPTVVFTPKNRDATWVTDLTTTGCRHCGTYSGNGFAIGRWK